MHELSLLRDLLKKLAEIDAGNTGTIAVVRIRIGALAHISEEHFREHWDHAIVGHPAQGAELLVDVSTDERDPRAQEIVLESVDIDE